MNSIAEQHFTQNRELSWLRFNERVLEEARDESVPLLERMGFVSIFTSNLDEFFMIRVGSLFDLMHLKEEAVDNKTGMTPKEQLEHIYAAVKPLYKEREEVYDSIEAQMRTHNIVHLTFDELGKNERKYIEQYFRASVEPVLSPQIIDMHHPFPHLQNKVLHVGAALSYKNKIMYAVVPIPAILPDVLYLPGGGVRYISMDEIIKHYLQDLFNTYQVVEQVTMCVTRNADINVDDEAFADIVDYRKKMRSVLKQRRRLAPVRLELSNPISAEMKKYLASELGLSDSQVFITKAPLLMGFVYDIADRLTPDKKRALTYRPFTPQKSGMLRQGESIISQVKKRDILLCYPFESMTPFLDMLKEAANDPATVSIKITIYRLAKQAKLVDYLCVAAENGKDVTVLIELRARFDEESNIDWSERLEEAGCNIIYGFEEYKVHSKICLITRRERGEFTYITQIGTGNYNEKTAGQYTDLSLITGNREIGNDANDFFKNMSLGDLHGQYKHLLASPVSLKTTVLGLIDKEIEKGKNGLIRLKLNSITDIDIIEKLKQASCAGVEIKMCVRGICCILPGIPGKTENLSVYSIVGRYLEHSRIYCFGRGDQEKIYISSADFMTRNTERRVEIACPVYSEEIKAKIRKIIEIEELDTEKARIMCPDGSYIKKKDVDGIVDSQLILMQAAEKQSEYQKEHDNSTGFAKRITEYFKNILRKK